MLNVYSFQNTYMAAYNIYAPTPPKSFHPSMKKLHKRKEGKHRGTNGKRNEYTEHRKEKK